MDVPGEANVWSELYEPKLAGEAFVASRELVHDQVGHEIGEWFLDIGPLAIFAASQSVSGCHFESTMPWLLFQRGLRTRDTTAIVEGHAKVVRSHCTAADPGVLQ